MRYGSKPGKLEKSVGESGFYRRKSKLGQFPYIFPNRQTVYRYVANGEIQGRLEASGFQDFTVTDKENEELNTAICNNKPRLVIIDI